MGKKIPPSVERAVAPGVSLKARFLKTADGDTLRGAARSFIFEAIRRGVLGGWLFAEEGMKGTEAIRGALKDVTSIFRGTPLVSCLNFEIYSRPLGGDEREWDNLLNISSGFGLSALRDDDEGICERLAEFARRRGKGVIIHFGEAGREDVERLLRLRPKAVVHLIHSSTEEIEKIKVAGIDAVFTPRANRFFKLRPPVVKAIALDLKWHLGSDNAMLTPPDILAEIREAACIAGGEIEATSRSIQAGVGEERGVYAVFRLPVNVRSPFTTPTIINHLEFLGYSVEGEGLLIIQNSPLP
ncbi:MAG: hypothetical protein J7L88_04190 [Thermoplasmata archaeon]|nr:hypothetical protein [Thermoplasmata archaeon]